MNVHLGPVHERVFGSRYNGAVPNVLLPGPSGLQGSLFGGGPLRLSLLESTVRHTDLDDDCRIDYVAGWIAGADELFLDLLEGLPWRSHRRWMVDHEVVEPRLSTSISEPSAPLRAMADALTDHYYRGYVAAWANLYRNGHDSVAWHGDRHRPGSLHDDVALISTGAPRTFRVRPRGGGPSLAWTLTAGDLLVMRGPVQQRFEHCVPKASSAGPRISVAFRCPSGREFDQVVNSGPSGPRRLDHRL